MTPAGSSARAPCRPRPRGRASASSWCGSEGVLGVITEATLRVRPAPGGAPLRGLVLRELRGGLRGLPRDGAGRCRRGRQPALGRGRDAAVDGARLVGRQGGEAGPALPAAARPRGRVPRDHRLRGRRGRGRGPPPAAAGALLRAGGGVALGHAGRATPGCAAATPGPTCATSCSTAASWSRRSRPPRAGPTSARSTPRWRRRCARALAGARHAAARDVPRLAPLPVGRVALLHLPGAPGGGRARPVARGEGGGVGGDRRRGRHDHPPSRDRPRPPAVDAGGGRGGRRRGCSEPPRSGSTPRGS